VWTAWSAPCDYGPVSDDDGQSHGNAGPQEKTDRQTNGDAGGVECFLHEFSKHGESVLQRM